MEGDNFFWPPPEPDFPGWLANFYEFVDDNATALGFTPAEVLWLKSESEFATYTGKAIDDLHKLWLDYIKLRNVQYKGDKKNAALPSISVLPMPDLGIAPAAVAPKAKATLDGMVKRVASNTTLTDEQKRSAGVLSKERTTENPSTATPPLTVTVVNGQAVLSCPLRNFKGYIVYVEDNGAAAILLGTSVSKKYVDTRPIPTGMQTQQRTYFVQYVGIKNQPVGNVSVKITVAVLRVI